MKQYILALEQETVPGARSVLAELDPEVLTTIESATRTAWLPIEINFDATDRLTRMLGVERGDEFFRRLYAGFLDGPVLGPLIRGIRSLGARSPLAYLKHTPRSYSAVFRDVGVAEVLERSDRSIELGWTELPNICWSPTMPWIRYTAAIYALSFDLAGCPGTYRVHLDAPGSGRARIVFEW